MGELRNLSKIYVMKITRRLQKEGKDVSETGSISCELNPQRSIYDSELKCYERNNESKVRFHRRIEVA
jgi:hypothetical protein